MAELTLKIWIVFQNAAPPSQNAVMRPFYFGRELTRRGHEVTIIASGFNHRSLKHLPFADREHVREDTAEGIRFLWLKTPGYGGNTVGRFWDMLVFAHRVLTHTTRRLPRPDVILGSSPPLFSAAAAERVARRLGVPFVLEIRDLWPQTMIDVGGFSPWHPVVLLQRGLERRLYRRADRIVTVLPNAARYITARGGVADKIDLIPNGVDLRSMPEPSPAAASNHFTVMYAGAHGVTNGLDTILDAAALVQQNSRANGVRFRLIGDGVEKERLRRRADLEGLINVSFDEPVPNARIYEVLKEADIFIANVPNKPVYGYGISINKIFEYMGMARPTAVAVSAFNNPVAESRSGLTVPSDDALGLADAVVALASMPAEERWEMGLRGRRYVEEHHSFDRLTVQLEHTLASLAPSELSRGFFDQPGRPAASDPR